MSTEASLKHLLIPLDGSRLAEAALPAAARLASKLHASVMLIHLIERNAPPEVHSERHLTEPAEAKAYLEQVARRAFPPDLLVEAHVHTTEVSDVARSLVEHASELHTELIVMCTHGRGGLRDLLYGSIAQQVVGLGTTPVLLIRPTDSGDAPAFACRMILVRLDDARADEAALALAHELAQACGAALHLVMVIRSADSLKDAHAATAKLMPLATNALLEMDEQEARGYLSRHAADLRAAGLAVTAEVARGEPAAYLLHTAQKVGADLLVLGTRLKSGLGAPWSGSVAPKLAGRSHTPLLLVPLREGAKAADPPEP